MSQNSSGNVSSQSSSPSLIRVVEQLIESDEQEKNNKKIVALKAQFPVLKRIYPFSTNSQKLQIFLHDQNFKNKVTDKLLENGILTNQYAPVIKSYLVSTRYGAPVTEQFDQNDIQLVFQKFGQINNFYITKHCIYIWFHSSISSFLAVKALNGLQVSEWLRLMVKFCNQDQILEAYNYFSNLRNNPCNHTYSNQFLNLSKPSLPKYNNYDNNKKYIAKFQLGVDNLPEFNIAQRLIGPRGNYMKKIIQKVLQNQPHHNKYTLNNIDNVLKIRYIPKSPINQAQSQQRSHIFISSKEQTFYQNSCREVQLLLRKVLQQYKISFQKVYHRHAQGIAYKFLELHCTEFIETKHVNIQQIQNSIDILCISKQPKLSPKIIQQKISERQKARRIGKYQQADKIRNWLKTKGVIIVDSKSKGQKSSWHYLV